MRLAERDISTGSNELYVPLPCAGSTPAWGGAGTCSLAITIDLVSDWGLVLDQPHSPVVDLVGRCDEAGIDAMLDLAMIVNAGAFGNVFRQP